MNSVRIELSLLLGDVGKNKHTGFLPEIVLSFCKNSKRMKETTLEMLSKKGFSPVQSPSCVWLCDPIDCSMPGFPVQLPELAQIHVHWVGGTIQPSHPLSSPSPPAFNLSQHQKRISIEIRCFIKFWMSFGYTQTSKNAIATVLPGEMVPLPKLGR